MRWAYHVPAFELLVAQITPSFTLGLCCIASAFNSPHNPAKIHHHHNTTLVLQVDGNTLCVRDGGEWKDCPVGSDLESWKEMICASLSMKTKGHLPEVCKDVGPSLSAAAGVSGGGAGGDSAAVAVAR